MFQTGERIIKGRKAAVNYLIAALSQDDQDRLHSQMERERGELKQLLYEKGGPILSVYFPIDAVVSVMAILTDDSSVEVASIGNEGMVGSPLLIGSRFMRAQEFAQVQVPGDLLRMDAEAFLKELAKDGSFRYLVQGHVRALFGQISQQAACNGVHTVEERCSRRLLHTHDRVGSDEFPITQEFLSRILGVRRASVTLAAGVLQDAGFIRYRRGHVRIVDRGGLEMTSCECYRAVRDEFDVLLGGGPVKRLGV